MTVHKVKCVKASSLLHMFKENELYDAVLKSNSKPAVLVVQDGVFNLEITFNNGVWKNPNEDVEFQYIGESEHY